MSSSPPIASAGRRPRLLVLTPDFPPAPGGIQVVVHRLATGLRGFEVRVIALGSPGAAAFDRGGELSTRRIGAGALPRGARNLLLNGTGFAEALQFRADVVLSAHIVVSPAAAAVRRALRARVLQYFYAEEVAAKPKLAAFAAREADVVVAISEYTAGLVLRTGAAPRRMRLIPPGVDIPADVTQLPAECPTVLTIARLQERYKGHDTMVRAMSLVLARVPDARWVVVGDG